MFFDFLKAFKSLARLKDPSFAVAYIKGRPFRFCYKNRALKNSMWGLVRKEVLWPKSIGV